MAGMSPIPFGIGAKIWHTLVHIFGGICMSEIVLVRERSFLKDVALVVSWSLALGLLGKLMIPLPFTPVPLALRPQLVLAMAALLGPKRAAWAVLGFLAQGMMGLPVLTQGTFGWASLMGPNGGYLIGYLVAALVTGWLAKRNLGLSLAAGTGVIYLLGAGYLATFVGVEKAFLLGIVPFLIGDFIKGLLTWQMVKFAQKRGATS